MGERYKGWLKNPDASKILHGFGLPELTDDQQTLLEDVYSMQGNVRKATQRATKITELASILKINRGQIKGAVAFLSNLTYSPGTDSGTDPEIFIGDGHHKGSANH